MENDLRSMSWPGGCLRAAMIAAGLVIALPLGAWAWITWDQPRGQLPSTVRYVSIVHSSQSSGLREGCFEAIYKLAPETVARLRREGVATLNGATIPKENPRNAYGLWRPTPLNFVRVPRSPTDSEFKAQPDPATPPFTLFAQRAESGCGAGGGPVSVSKMLARPGGFYTITGNAEGLIVIDTRQGLAAVVYAG
jgi:hypothetical protein